MNRKAGGGAGIDTAGFFEVGIIVNTHGVKGEVRVIPTTDDPNRFGLLGHVFVCGRDGGVERRGIEGARPHKQFVILRLEGIGDMESAGRLKLSVLKIEPENALPLGEREYYVRDLIGMGVFTEGGEEAGAVTNVLRTGANDVYEVKREGYADAYIPAVAEFVASVDVKARRMVIRPIDGMLPGPKTPKKPKGPGRR